MHQGNLHHNLQVKCSMDEPIELLIDKLSTKSTDLYVFWQNYDQLYRHYNQKNNENIRLREQIQQLRRVVNSPKPVETRTVQDPYLKQKLNDSQRNLEKLRHQNDRLKVINNELTNERTRNIEELESKNLFINQLKQENRRQKENIDSILIKMKHAQNQLKSYSQIFEQIQEKDAIILKVLEKEKQLQRQIEQKDDEIERQQRNIKEMKKRSEKAIKESLQNAKQAVINNLPSNYKSFRD